ncbi:hypothetical protein LIER_06857 [Lithospermum erythrorhizon]|uniref:Transposase MuDR plant domain-containing protein n=1 Tax=Lithospermum erythrorhizon TaxID=34254 RepID=A0AAV3PAD9_LITER
MCKWVPTARNIDVYVIHPAWRIIRRQLLYENYRSYRDLWPQVELREIDKVETKLMEIAKENDEKQHYYLEWKQNGEDNNSVKNVDNVEVGENLGVDNVEVQNLGVDNVEVQNLGSGEKKGEVQVGNDEKQEEVEDDHDDIVEEFNRVDMAWFDNYLDGGVEGCSVNDFSVYVDEMEGDEDTRHMDGDIGGNVENQTEHLNGEQLCYPNEGVSREALEIIDEDIDSDSESEGNQFVDDEAELPPIHDFEQESEDDDSDGAFKGPVMFNKYKHLQTPALIPNMIFAHAEEFRSLMREYALVTRRDVKLPINEKHRVQGVCRVKGCPFKVFCSKNRSEENISIKIICGAHSCGPVIKNRQVNVKWLVTKAIKAAGYLIYGNEIEQFAKIQSYAYELLQTMPGSTVIIKMEEQKFLRIYICLAPLKASLKDGCRKFLCLDGCFLKGSFKGQILVVVGLDADNGIYHVAWAVVEVENTLSWTSFVKLLPIDFAMDVVADEWILMIDQQKGLENSITVELPHAEHQLCVKLTCQLE